VQVEKCAAADVADVGYRPLFVYPPPPATGGIPVTDEDVKRLDDGMWLNDSIIGVYLK